MVTCAVCQKDQDRIHRSVKGEVPFVCRGCRCRDCYIVLSYEECSVDVCKMRHGKPSKEDPGVCEACMMIRARVALLDREALELRRSEAILEQP